MNDKVLVTYASKYGATVEIAARIGQILHQEDVSNDVLGVDDVGDVTAYQAVVLGSAVYMGGWRKKAANFLKENQEALAERPVWLFSSGPTGEGDPAELLDGWLLPGKLQPIVDHIQPQDIALFHGALDLEKLNFIERTLVKNVKSPVGDFRDWETIEAWAETIAKTLKEEAPA